MKIKYILTTILLLAVSTGFYSCNQDDKDNDVPTGSGIIKVSVNYSPPSSSTYIYTLAEPFTVKLKKDGSVLGTQYTSGGTLDMGVYDYGTYEVNVTGRERKTRISNGSTVINETYNTTKTVELDASTKTASFSF